MTRIPLQRAIIKVNKIITANMHIVPTVYQALFERLYSSAELVLAIVL